MLSAGSSRLRVVVPLTRSICQPSATIVSAPGLYSSSHSGSSLGAISLISTLSKSKGCKVGVAVGVRVGSVLAVIVALGSGVSVAAVVALCSAVAVALAGSVGVGKAVAVGVGLELGVAVSVGLGLGVGLGIFGWLGAPGVGRSSSCHSPLPSGIRP